MPIADLIQFNMFGANDAIKERWGISKDDLAYNQVFYQAGYKNSAILPNLGLIILLFIIAAAYLIVAFIKDLYVIRHDTMNPLWRKRIVPYATNFMARLVSLCFLEILICCIINGQSLNFDDSRLKVSSYVTIGFGVTCLAFLLFTLSLTCCHDLFIDKTSEEVSPYYSTLFHGLNKKHPLRSAIYPSWFLLRRVIYAWLLIYAPDHPVGQIFILAIMSLIMLFIIWGLKPYESGENRCL